MRQFKHIANNIVEVTDSIKTVLGGQDGKTHLGLFIQNASNTFAQFSNVGDLLSRSLARNEQNIDAFLSIGNNLKDVTDRLQRDVFPSFQNSIEKISQVFDRDFDRIATHLSTTAESLDQASVQAREGMEKISSVAQKIDEGKGLIGKLINEDETYNDLRSAIQGFRSYVSRIERMQVLFDSHFESMHRSAENFKLQDSKGYFDVRIHPNEDHFYLIQFASSQKGYITRQETLRHYVDKHLETINVNNLILPDGVFIKEPLRKQKTKINRNGIKIGLQFGKIFGDIALRFGFFDGTAGVGCDVDIPFGTEKFRWVTSLELFDMSGWNRIDDRRPHFKWINKMYFMRNLYFVFGADDFISKNNASGFVGAGLRFGDDDVKYLLSSISGVSGSPVS
jgi:phospholipid/cholesterol/gamma-HCH transport system substrate-binding protein